MNPLPPVPGSATLVDVDRSRNPAEDIVGWTTRYLTHVVAELTVAGLCADDIERAVEMTLVDLHTANPQCALEAVDAIRANLGAALDILRDDRK